MIRSIGRAAGVGGAVLALSAAWLPAAQATARVRPSVTFSFVADRVTQNTKLHLSYADKHLPRRSVIYLQWQVGTRHVWQNVEKIRTARTASAPGVQIGRYDYRLLVVSNGKAVAASATRDLYSYGKIPWATLCSDYGNFGPCAPPATVQIGTTVFTYVYESSEPPSYPTYENFLQLPDTSCKTMTVQFATSDTNAGDYAYLQLVQSKTAAQYGQTPEGTIGSTTFRMDGGPFYLNDAESVGYSMFFNGSAICYTRNGLP
jgi:hypothetical protein